MAPKKKKAVARKSKSPAKPRSGSKNSRSTSKMQAEQTESALASSLRADVAEHQDGDKEDKSQVKELDQGTSQEFHLKPVINSIIPEEASLEQHTKSLEALVAEHMPAWLFRDLADVKKELNLDETDGGKVELNYEVIKGQRC